MQIDDLASEARKRGYTAVVVKNVMDQAGPGTQYVVFSPRHIKSAEPFAYRDDGSLVPLDQRFAAVEDIRGDVSGRSGSPEGEAGPW